MSYATLPTPTHRQQLTSVLHDLWQREERTAWQLDAWLLINGRACGDYDRQSVTAARRSALAARHAVKQILLARGRNVLRAPAAPHNEAGSTDRTATRNLQRVFTQTRLLASNCALARQLAEEARDYALVCILADVADALAARLCACRALNGAYRAGQATSTVHNDAA